MPLTKQETSQNEKQRGETSSMSGLHELTKHLLDLHPETLTRATEHPFLQAAGDGSLPTRKLRDWLAQDVHYTRGYVRFIGGLMARLRLEWAVRHGPSSQQSQALQHDIFGLLTDALVNLRREMAFFQDVDEQYGLGVTAAGEAKRVRATRGYIELFDQWSGYGSGGHHWQPPRQETPGPDEHVLYGLVCLWATEMCYLRAWSFAAKVMRGEVSSGLQKSTSNGGDETTAAAAALREKLVPNWSSNEFAAFVERCAGATDATARDLDEQLQGSTEAKRAVVLENCRSVYLSVLELEEQFWPTSRQPSS